jgi:hypothetical protein
MNDKTLFSIYLPATLRSYEFWIPNELRVYEACQLLGKLLSSQEERSFCSTADTALFDYANGNELDINQSIGALGYANGSRLMII